MQNALRSFHRQNESRLPLVLSALALIVSIATFIMVWQRFANLRISAHDGGAYVVFVDAKGSFRGSIADDYDALRFTGLGYTTKRGVDLEFGDRGASFTLHRTDRGRSRWLVTEEGARFEKNPTW
jgi:hypothetical protein